MYQCNACKEYKSKSILTECEDCSNIGKELEYFAEIGKALMTLNGQKEFGVTINIPKMLKEFRNQDGE